MAHRTIHLSRDELYAAVWERPVSAAAKSYGISDVGLAKMCRRLGVPIPGLGYWAKKQHGKPVERKPLPPPAPDAELEVAISPYHAAPPDEVQLTRANELVDAEHLSANEIRVADALVVPHPLIARALKVLSKAKPGSDGILRAGNSLAVTVSPAQLNRAIRIMDALLRAFEARGFAVSSAGDGRDLQVSVLDEPLTIGLTEDRTTTKRPLAAEQQDDLDRFGWRSRPQYDYSPSGKLALQVHAGLWNGMRRRWTDSSRKPLERSLNAFLVGLIKISVAVRAQRLERERRDHGIAEAKRRRDELIRLQQQEKAELEALEGEVSLWDRARRIREYLAAVRQQAIRRHGRIDEGSEMDQWLNWAEEQADRFDPLVPSPPSVLDQPAPNPYE